MEAREFVVRAERQERRELDESRTTIAEFEQTGRSHTTRDTKLSMTSSSGPVSTNLI